ncbi:hypothetical protein D0817_00380 [Flavobacterium cupreum]|uniref:HEAT repeat domain-containing protein n=1 Tax=Flavobacterium cupreum TaxID=2133766 RepID=A0A434ACM8_9FLAO|nr:hypothetical protein [Flavobacterium cupreum]RUT72114.1 hypothetical protein D0817_00380 [Flavobacterium cupreum]
MEKVWEFYKGGAWVEYFLIVSTVLFIVVAFILYLMIVRSRNSNIRKEKLTIEYTILIEKILFALIFEDTSLAALKENQDFSRLIEDGFFREVLTESVISLHKNYEGIYARKLEQFYKESGLIQDSFKKLRNPNWEIKCKGITEVAEMNITRVFSSILTVSKAQNKTLKITALNACIKLGGVKGITHLTEHPYPIDDWTQVNIISAFKKHDIGDTEGVEFLLESQNTTVVALGLKLIRELKLTQKLPYVAELAARTHNTIIQYEAQNVLKTLNA